jgi:hypothetical protein
VCSITPTQARLARTKSFRDRSSRQPVAVGQRDAWLDELRATLGEQRIEVEGIDPATRVARVIVEADYHMKLVGLGLEPAVDGVVNYLDSLERRPGETPPELGVLRWWFTLRRPSVQRAMEGRVFRLARQVVRVCSENEILTQLGQRVPTGQADPENESFARDFTSHFSELALKYPVYAELENVFRLAIVAAVLQEEDLPHQVAWTMNCLLDGKLYQVPTARAPHTVLSVVNYRVVDRRRFLAAVSGGVSFRRDDLLDGGIVEPQQTGTHGDRPLVGQSPPDDEMRWWWD